MNIIKIPVKIGYLTLLSNNGNSYSLFSNNDGIRDRINYNDNNGLPCTNVTAQDPIPVNAPMFALCI